MIPTRECPSRSRRDLGMDTVRQQVRGVGVPKIVEADPRQIDLADRHLPGVREAARLHRLAILARVNKGGVVLPNAKAQQFLGLPHAMLAQLLRHRAGQRDRAAPARFRRLVPHAGRCLLGALDNRQLAGFEGRRCASVAPRSRRASARTGRRASPASTSACRAAPRSARPSAPCRRWSRCRARPSAGSPRRLGCG